MKEVTTEKYMTVNEVAEALKVTDRTIRNMIGKLRNVQSPVQQNKQVQH
jgi:transcriptional antiterminator